MFDIPTMNCIPSMHDIPSMYIVKKNMNKIFKPIIESSDNMIYLLNKDLKIKPCEGNFQVISCKKIIKIYEWI